jgi:hypothetical protein
MQVLAETQLVNVQRMDFLLEQILIHMPVALFWMAGLVWLFGRAARRYRLIGVTFILVVLLLLVLRGKSYYTLGAYPMLFAAGGVWLEKAVAPVRWSIALLAVIVGIALSPFSTAYLPVDSMVNYGQSFIKRTGVDAPLRWETGVLHELPQDYADMLGWRELAGITMQAYNEAGDRSGTVIYADNYGQAGAIEYYGRDQGLPEVISFGDSYRLWAPDSLSSALTAFVYVSEGPDADMGGMFGASRVIGRVENEHARERGTTVFLFTEPDSTALDFYAEIAARMKMRLSTGD